MTQESMVYADSDQDDEEFTFDDFVLESEALPILDPFAKLSPTFKELCALYKDNCDLTERSSIESLLSGLISKKRTQIASSLGPRVGTLISSHVPSNKRRKTHGTKHMR